jgi:hypothetical protein
VLLRVLFFWFEGQKKDKGTTSSIKHVKPTVLVALPRTAMRKLTYALQEEIAFEERRTESRLRGYAGLTYEIISRIPCPRHEPNQIVKINL